MSEYSPPLIHRKPETHLWWLTALFIALNIGVFAWQILTGVDARKALEAAPLEIDLISPEPGSTLRDNTGNIVFQGEISPQVPVQYDVRLILNGKAVPLVHNSLAIRVENLDRGAYEARLELLAKDGTILAKSKPTTFYLHRASVNQAPRAAPKAN